MPAPIIPQPTPTVEGTRMAHNTTSAVLPVNTPMTGPEAIAHAVGKLDLAKLKEEHMGYIKAGKVSKRPRAVHVLNAIEGLERNNLTPSDLLLSSVPVIPPVFRPFSVISDVFIPGDANELYRDLFDVRRGYHRTSEMYGDTEPTKKSRLMLYDSVKALFGYGEPVKEKTKQRGVSGFLQQVTGCHDDETEILTRKYGWVLFKGLPEDTEVATVNPGSLAFEWQTPSEYQHFRYIGEMFHFRKKTRLDAVVTPGHTMWVKPRGRSVAAERVDESYMREGWIKQPAYTTAAGTGRRWLQTSTCGWEGQFTPPAFLTGSAVAFARLVGLWLAEGWLKRKNRTLLCQCPDSNPATVIFIRETIQALGLPYSEEHLDREPTGFNKKKSRQFRWSIDSEPLNQWLLQACGSGSKDKFISREVKDWPVELLRELFQAYLHGDGNKRQVPPSRNGGHTHKFRNTFTDSHDAFSTASEKLQGDWTEVGLKLGLSIYRRKPAPEGYDATIFRNAIIGRWNSVMEEDESVVLCDYDGYVHCCTVPNGLLITRRNTHTFVSGNSSPKTGFFQRKMISKPVDSVGRSTIIIDPDLSLDEIGIPEEIAWTSYAPYIQRRLVRAGMSGADAVRHLKERSPEARKALDREIPERPVVYSRAPAWHRFNVISGKPKLIQGNAIAINPLIGTGFNADFDGDQINVHVPSHPDAVKEAFDVLMPSRMLHSIREPDKVMPVPKHEMILGLHTALARPAKNTHRFPNEKAALAAVKSGAIPLSDEVTW